MPSLLASGTCLLLVISSNPGFAASTSSAFGSTAVLTTPPPFNGTIWKYSGSSISGCGGVTSTNPGTFNLSNGTAGFQGAVSVNSCSASRHQQAEIIDQIQVTVVIPFHTAHPTIFANFSYSVVANLTLSLGNCTLGKAAKSGFCQETDWFNLTGYTYFLDASSKHQHHTLSNTTYPSIGSLIDKYVTCSQRKGCTSGSLGTPGPASYSGTFSQQYSPPSRMVRNHTYEVVWFMECTIETSLDTQHTNLAPSTASVSEDAATQGQGISLLSVAET